MSLLLACLLVLSAISALAVLLFWACARLGWLEKEAAPIFIWPSLLAFALSAGGAAYVGLIAK